MNRGVSISSLNLRSGTMAALCQRLCGDGCRAGAWSRSHRGRREEHKATIEDLLQLTPQGVLATRGIGPVGMEELRKQLSDRGLVLRGEKYGDVDGLMLALACLDEDQLQEVYIRLDELMTQRVTRWKNREELGLPGLEERDNT